MNAAFAKLNQMLDEFRGSRPPLREHVGSDRRPHRRLATLLWWWGL